MSSQCRWATLNYRAIKKCVRKSAGGKWDYEAEAQRRVILKAKEMTYVLYVGACVMVFLSGVIRCAASTDLEIIITWKWID